MGKGTIISYPLEVLTKCKTALEMNIRGVPGMMVHAEMIPVYNKQIQQLKRAIEYIELHEKRESRRRAATKERSKKVPAKK